MKKYYNQLRNAACVILVFTALLLIYQIWSMAVGTSKFNLLRRAFFNRDVQEQYYPGYAEQSWALDVITPLCCAVRSGSGAGLYGTPNRETASVCFEKVSAVLAEALETSKAPVEVSDVQWQEAMSQTMVYMKFGGNIPLATLAGILGAEAPSGLTDTAACLILSVAGEPDGKIMLLYQNSDGINCRLETMADMQYLTSICQEAVPNGYCFEWELIGEDAHEAVLLQPNAQVPELTAVSILEASAETDANRFLDGILENFEFNTYMPHSYRESDGTQVYVDEERQLRVSVDGWVSYFDLEADRNSAYDPDEGEKAVRIAEAAKAASAAEASFTGDAKLYLMDAVYNEENGLFIIRFGAEYGGYPILNDRGYAVQVEFRGTELVSVNFLLRSFHNTGGNIAVLPSAQAIKAAHNKRGFGLCYVLNKGTISAGWYEADSIE